jgi:hypothetical protein
MEIIASDSKNMIAIAQKIGFLDRLHGLLLKKLHI